MAIGREKQTRKMRVDAGQEPSKILRHPDAVEYELASQKGKFSASWPSMRYGRENMWALPSHNIERCAQLNFWPILCAPLRRQTSGRVPVCLSDRDSYLCVNTLLLIEHSSELQLASCHIDNANDASSPDLIVFSSNWREGSIIRRCILCRAWWSDWNILPTFTCTRSIGMASQGGSFGTVTSKLYRCGRSTIYEFGGINYILGWRYL